MGQDIKCFFGVHQYEVHGEVDIKLIGTDINVAKNIICRCRNCGKLHIETVSLTSNSY